jgi:uncharacterized membrane protein YeaQ/YmgE (transglycosylase-associated protein family)
MELQSLTMLPNNTPLATETVASQFGGFFMQIVLFIAGVCLVASALSDRRTDGKGDGRFKVAIGAFLLLMLVGSFINSPR